MGDRTRVTLTVLNTQLASLTSMYAPEYMANDICSDDTFTNLVFDEVNYGTLKFLDKLQEAGIAYESKWDSGSEYGSGIATCRFTPDGSVILKEMYDADDNPSISTLVSLINDYEQLKSYILGHVEACAVLPWDNQVEYSRLFLARQLITP